MIINSLDSLHDFNNKYYNSDRIDINNDGISWKDVFQNTDKLYIDKSKINFKLYEHCYWWFNKLSNNKVYTLEDFTKN
jgi:hypothetical protein